MSAPDLHLEPGPAVGERLAAQPADLVVVVAEPADRRRVGRVAVAPELGLAFGRASGRARSRSASASLGRQGVGDVAEVDEGDDLARRHLASELPHRLAGPLRDEVPDGVDDGRRREVDDALLRPDPAQLAVADERRARTPPRSATSSSIDRPDDQRPQRLDGRDDDLGAAADRERQAVALEPVAGVGRAGRRRRPSSRGPGSSRRSRRGRARSGSGRR